MHPLLSRYDHVCAASGLRVLRQEATRTKRLERTPQERGVRHAQRACHDCCVHPYLCCSSVRAFAPALATLWVVPRVHDYRDSTRRGSILAASESCRVSSAAPAGIWSAFAACRVFGKRRESSSASVQACVRERWGVFGIFLSRVSDALSGIFSGISCSMYREVWPDPNARSYYWR